MTVASIPADPALPHLHSLVDPERMGRVLARSLPPELPAPVVRITYLRYRPGRSLLVCYEADVGGATCEVFALADAREDLGARAAAPASAALAASLGTRTPTGNPLSYEADLDAMLQWLPFDLALPAMAEPPERLRDRLVAAGLELAPHDLPRGVKHKPTTRGVLELEEHFVKVYRDADSFERSVRALGASASLPFATARCTAVLPELLIATQSRLRGERPVDSSEVALEVGALLAVLHRAQRSDLPVELPHDQLASAAKQARLLSTVVPRLSPRVDAFIRRLEAALPTDDLVTSHGGFHGSQILRDDGEVGVVDFDGMCLAPPALDIASYVASLVETSDDLDGAGETLDVLVDAYGARPSGVSWYLAARLLARARRPFTRLRPGWPERVEEGVAAAEAVLES